ncbi:hypothetical protein HYW76_00910 [Candidatus Pacearchaeota archaeon]|nr:hypothetical protein [Candidatus Pacearchaeota archaeon]
MILTKELCEAMGMFAADGSMQENHICMWGNISEDRDYYDKIICPLFSHICKKEIKAHDKKSNSVYGFYICNKETIKLFRSMGFTRNKTYDVKMPPIILKSDNKKFYSSFVRGFADCDGFISFMKRRGKYVLFKRKFHTYPRIMIKIASKDMIRDLSYVLNKMSIRHTKYTYYPKKINLSPMHTIEIRGNERVNKYMNEVGFNNLNQYSKYKIWKKFGFCPSNTTIQQRNLILQGELNPKSFY